MLIALLAGNQVHRCGHVTGEEPGMEIGVAM